MVSGYIDCDWVRERLSLLVGDSDCLANERGDVSSEDRAQIDNHLLQCKSCRLHRTSLEQAMAILDSAAAEPWNGLTSSSVWPDLEAQIRHRCDRTRPFWQQLITTIVPKWAWLLARHLGRAYDRIRGEAPLQLAWTYDSLYEFFQHSFRFLPIWMTSEIAIPVWKGRRLVLAFGVPATLALLLLLVFVSAHRQEFHAEAQIAVNTATEPVLERRSPGPPEQTMDVIIATEPVTNSHASNSLTQAEAVSSIEPAKSRLSSAPIKAVATATSELTSAPISPPRYDFFLEMVHPCRPSRGE